MFARILRRLTRAPDTARDTLQIGDHVLETDTGTRGVVAGTYLFEGIPVARVVFTGHRSSWVGVIERDRLIPCP